MQQYNSMHDANGNISQNRVCVFVYFDSIAEDATFANYQFADKITSEKAGLLFVIDQEEVDNLHHYKISYDSRKPMLVKREESAE